MTSESFTIPFRLHLTSGMEHYFRFSSVCDQERSHAFLTFALGAGPNKLLAFLTLYLFQIHSVPFFVLLSSRFGPDMSITDLYLVIACVTSSLDCSAVTENSRFVQSHACTLQVKQSVMFFLMITKSYKMLPPFT